MGKGRLLTMLGCLLVSGVGQAQVEVSGPVEYGVFISPNTELKPGERIISQNAVAMEQTQEVPAKLGAKFGLRFTLTGISGSEAPLTLLYLTPGVVTEQGVRHDKFVLTQKLQTASTKQVMAFEFTERHEVVPGEWHFIVFQDDRKLAEQRFTVR